MSSRTAAGADSGSVVEIDEAYRIYGASMVRLATLLVGSVELGREVVQDVFVSAHSRWGQILNPASYLRAAVINRSRGVQRRMIVERRHARAEPDVVIEDAEVDSLWSVVRSLPRDQRAAIVLRFYEDLTIAEIAHLLSKPEGTVKSLIHRGLGRLKGEVG